ncbi:MAG: hypothetical protein R3F46_09645 [bacterium]
MKYIASLLLALLIHCTAAHAAPVCDYSGEDWESSSTRVSVVLDVDGHPATLHFNSLYYMFRYINEQQAAGQQLGRVQNFSMLDYGSRGGSAEHYLNGTGDTRPAGWFLWTNHVLPGSAYPYIAAFEDQRKAQERMKEWGGEIMDAEEMVTQLFAFYAGRHGMVDEHSGKADAGKSHDSHSAAGSHSGGHH